MIVIFYRNEIDDDFNVFALSDRASQILFISTVFCILLSVPPC
jgi:hypothetical protein